MDRISILYCILFSLFFSLSATDKVLIITHVYNRPDFIEIHAESFKAFLKDDYEYIVFNDAPNDDMHRDRLNKHAPALGITLHSCSTRIRHRVRGDPESPGHMHGIQFSLEQRVMRMMGL